jgi:hypothetical protein
MKKFPNWRVMLTAFVLTGGVVAACSNNKSQDTTPQPVAQPAMGSSTVEPASSAENSATPATPIVPADAPLMSPDDDTAPTTMVGNPSGQQLAQEDEGSAFGSSYGRGSSMGSGYGAGSGSGSGSSYGSGSGSGSGSGYGSGSAYGSGYGSGSSMGSGSSTPGTVPAPGTSPGTVPAPGSTPGTGAPGTGGTGGAAGGAGGGK